jgi:DNA-binding transcriptional MerR regulator/methylmalonyl-CoA mutase cobalamin-binding subunit
MDITASMQPMDKSTPATEPFHSLGVVCRRTGLKPDRLRAWERRYGVVNPARSDGNQRLYSDADIERLGLLKRATEGGHRIAHISDLSTPELAKLVTELAPVTPSPLRSATPSEMALADSFLNVALAAIQQLNTQWLRTSLQQASSRLAAPVFMQDLLVPLLDRVGDLWQEGGLQVAHEHAASAVIRAFIDDMRAEFEVTAGAPSVVMTTLAGELHELGALIATATAASDGWDVTYLGPNLPAEQIALVARQKGSRAIGLSIVLPEDDESLAEELHMLRRHVGTGISIIVGGRGASAASAALEEIDAIQAADLRELRQILSRLLPTVEGAAEAVTR